jgi:hypothetical protein
VARPPVEASQDLHPLKNEATSATQTNNVESFDSFAACEHATIDSIMTAAPSSPKVNDLAKTNAYAAQTVNVKLPQSIWETATPVTVQGGALKTYSCRTGSVKRMQVALRTEGRPLNANVELWQGPDNTPQKMAVYIEDGCVRPFSALISIPRDHNSIAIRNTGQMEFPLAACIEADADNGYEDVINHLSDTTSPDRVQGGSLKTYSFAPTVTSVQILLKTDGRPLNARIELLQGPNSNKQVIELYNEDGLERPFFAVIETPGVGNVVRIVNTGQIEFPISARVEPYRVEAGSDESSGGWNCDAFSSGWGSYGR